MIKISFGVEVSPWLRFDSSDGGSYYKPLVYECLKYESLAVMLAPWWVKKVGNAGNIKE